jgi:hypothetical protein
MPQRVLKRHKDDISIRSSQSSEDSAGVQQSKCEPDETESVFSSDFVPREAIKVAKAQEKKEAQKLQAIKENRTFIDPEIEPLLSLLPLAKIKMKQMPVQSKQREELQMTILNIKCLLERLDENM